MLSSAESRINKFSDIGQGGDVSLSIVPLFSQILIPIKLFGTVLPHH